MESIQHDTYILIPVNKHHDHGYSAFHNPSRLLNNEQVIYLNECESTPILDKIIRFKCKRSFVSRHCTYCTIAGLCIYVDIKKVHFCLT